MGNPNTFSRVHSYNQRGHFPFLRGCVAAYAHVPAIAVASPEPLHDSDVICMFRLMLAEGRRLIRQRNTNDDRGVELLGERIDSQPLRTIPSV